MFVLRFEMVDIWLLSGKRVKIENCRNNISKEWIKNILESVLRKSGEESLESCWEEEFKDG